MGISIGELLRPVSINMAPSGLAILMGAGPTTAAGIARILAHPSHGNMAVALLSRTGDASLAERLSRESQGGTLRAFKTDTSEASLTSVFDEIKSWSQSQNLKLNMAIWNIKHSPKRLLKTNQPRNSAIACKPMSLGQWC